MKQMWGMGLGLGLLTALSACGSCQRTGDGLGEGTTTQFFIVCPNPQNGCSATNGTGVYFAEDGKAEIGPVRMMITHFINAGAQVNFAGRYFDPRTNLYYPLDTPGTVYAADFDTKTGLNVRSVEETGTEPTWRLVDPSNHNPVVATGNDLTKLKLYIQFTIPQRGDPQQPPKFTSAAGTRAAPGDTVLRYVLDFINPQVEQPFGHLFHAYEMRWRDLTSGSTTDYCGGKGGTADSVVYQQGIDVDPLSGRVTGSATSVTLSCGLGAPAVVHSWGYPYNDPSSEYFEAGIHMKRASYCGDNNYFTSTPTEIQIKDDRRIMRDPINNLEARWTVHGASCVNPDNVRHPGIVHDKGFTYSCNGQPLPTCHGPRPSAFLEEGPPVVPPPVP